MGRCYGDNTPLWYHTEEGRAELRSMTPGTAPTDRLALASAIHERSVRTWGRSGATVIIGRHPRLKTALDRLQRFSRADAPLLISGETGVGKELFARAAYLCSGRSGESFFAVNCAQYGSRDLVPSELFGHRRGAFTGAISDHQGIFRAADGGVVFLDEVGELSPQAQSMLLRIIAHGEYRRVGGTRQRRADVRIIAATNRDLGRCVSDGQFREDLYYRLRCLRVGVPPLRDRGDDWQLISAYYLRRMSEKYGATRQLTAEALAALGGRSWPGNVRELQSVLEYGYHVSGREQITCDDLGAALEEEGRQAELHGVLAGSNSAAGGGTAASDLCTKMVEGRGTFWDVLHQPFLRRDLSRSEMRATIDYALTHLSRGSYKRMLAAFGVADDQYLKAMDFLRHHSLKPE